jgi:hypothetical protein
MTQILRAAFKIGANAAVHVEFPQVEIDGTIVTCVVEPGYLKVALIESTNELMFVSGFGDQGILAAELSRLPLKLAARVAYRPKMTVTMGPGMPVDGYAILVVHPRDPPPPAPEYVIALTPRVR